MSNRKKSGKTPAESSLRINRLTQHTGGSLLRTARANPQTGVANNNFRPPVVSTQDSMIVHHYGRPRPSVPTLTPHCQGCTCHNNILLGYGTSNVTNWLQGDIPQRSFSNFTSVRFPPPARPNPLPTYPFAYPANENPNALQGFNYLTHNENLLRIGPSFRPTALLNIYMPTGPAPTSNSIIIIPDDSPPRTLTTTQSSPLGPSSQDKGKAKRSEEDGEHKCYACNKLFESGKALGGHMSAHEKKRKRELTEARKSFVTSAGDGAGSSRWCADRDEERDEIFAADEEEEETETKSKKIDV